MNARLEGECFNERDRPIYPSELSVMQDFVDNPAANSALCRETVIVLCRIVQRLAAQENEGVRE
jgi:hypothetical protein